jgi:uncharacterized protein YoxC
MSDVFRKQYVPLHEERSTLIQDIKNQAEILYELFEYVKDREMSLAKTNLEQAVMWAVKSITNNAAEPIDEKVLDE